MQPFLALVSAASIRLTSVSFFEEINIGGADPIAAYVGVEKQTVH